jgi:hypothetical protein
MERDKPILIRRESYDSESEEDKILFDLAKERSKSKP